MQKDQKIPLHIIGNFKSPNARNLLWDYTSPGRAQGLFLSLQSNIALGRLGEPDEVPGCRPGSATSKVNVLPTPLSAHCKEIFEQTGASLLRSRVTSWHCSVTLTHFYDRNSSRLGALRLTYSAITSRLFRTYGRFFSHMKVKYMDRCHSLCCFWNYH